MISRQRLIIIFSLYLGIFLLMFIPGQSHAKWMEVDVVTFGHTEKGTVTINTKYSAQTGSVPLSGGVEQNHYSNRVNGYGSPTTVQTALVVGAGSQVDFAGLTILKEPAKPSGECHDHGHAPGILVVEPCPPSDCIDGIPFSRLMAKETIGTGYTEAAGNTFESFAGAGGSWILVKETAHETVASTSGGEVYLMVDSRGCGQFKAGLASEFVRVVVPPEEAKEQGLLDPSQILFAEPSEPGTQSFSKNIRYTGRYTGYLEGVVGPPEGVAGPSE